MAAPYRGCSGAITVSTTSGGTFTAIGQMSDWQFSETSEQIDASRMNNSCAKSFLAGAKATTGTVTCWWDDDDTNGQNVLIVGNTVHLKIYPGGTGSGLGFYKTPSAGAVITSVERAGNGVDGVVGSTFGFAVNGQLTTTAVP